MSAGNVARRHTKSVYLGFQMVVLAALRARLKGWAPSGKYRLGRWGMPVNIGALVYGVAAIANVCWPRTPEAPWYDNYVVLLMSGVIISLGILYMVFSRAYANSDAPHADGDSAARDRSGSHRGAGNARGAKSIDGETPDRARCAEQSPQPVDTAATLGSGVWRRLQILQPYLTPGHHPIGLVGDDDQPQLLTPAAMQWFGGAVHHPRRDGMQKIGVVVDADHAPTATGTEPGERRHAGHALDHRAVHTAVHDAHRLQQLGFDL